MNKIRPFFSGKNVYKDSRIDLVNILRKNHEFMSEDSVPGNYMRVLPVRL